MINKLTDIYVKWCCDNNVPNVSADEQDRDKLTYEQKSWLDDFIENWDNQQSVDHFIHTNTHIEDKVGDNVINHKLTRKHLEKVWGKK